MFNAFEGTAVRRIHRITNDLRRSAVPRLRSRAGLRLLELSIHYFDALGHRRYATATRVIQEILLVASAAYAETAEVALRERERFLPLEEQNEVGDRDHRHDEVEEQRRKRRNARQG